jgi:hypothetical protein
MRPRGQQRRLFPHSAQAHGGAVRLRNLPQGGLEATLVLPRGA